MIVYHGTTLEIQKPDIQQIYDGSFGIENMDYRYLVQDLIENEPELFRKV